MEPVKLSRHFNKHKKRPARFSAEHSGYHSATSGSVTKIQSKNGYILLVYVTIAVHISFRKTGVIILQEYQQITAV